MTSILFVCTGNICRSPSAEGVVRNYAENHGCSWRLDSAGTHAYHIGEAPDPRSVATARKRGFDIGNLRARKIMQKDFYDFDLILALDEMHLRFLRAMQPQGAKAAVHLFLEYGGVAKPKSVPDPYYGTESDFEHTLDLIEQGAYGILTKHIAINS